MHTLSGLKNAPNNRALKYTKKAPILNNRSFLSVAADSATPANGCILDFLLGGFLNVLMIGMKILCKCFHPKF